MEFNPDQYIQEKSDISRDPANAKNLAVTRYLANKDYDGLRTYLKDMTGNQIYFDEIKPELNKVIDVLAAKNNGLSNQDLARFFSPKTSNYPDPTLIKDSRPMVNGIEVGGVYDSKNNTLTYSPGDNSVYLHEYAHYLDQANNPGFISDSNTSNVSAMAKMFTQKGLENFVQNYGSHMAGGVPDLQILEGIVDGPNGGKLYNPTGINRSNYLGPNPKGAVPIKVDPSSEATFKGSDWFNKVNPGVSFNPDQYLNEKSFNPSDYLVEKQQLVNQEPIMANQNNQG